MKPWLPVLLIAALFPAGSLLSHVTITFDDPVEPADLIIHNAKVLTVDAKFSVAQAIAVKGDRVLAVGDDKTILRHKGPKTRLFDVAGKTVLPGLYDSHVHPVGAATSELVEPLPPLKSLDDVFAYIRG